MTTEHPTKGPEIDAEPMELEELPDDTLEPEGDADEPQKVDDGDDEPHPFTPADYEAAAAELAAEASTAGDGEPDPKMAAHVAKLRKEAAASRTALQAATAEVAALKEYQQGRMRFDAEQMAQGHRMLVPAELWHVAELADLVDPDTGDLDEARVAAVIAEKVPAHWKVQPRTDSPRYSEPRSGASGAAEYRPTNWSRALGPNEG